jgi:hypothetical protein
MFYVSFKNTSKGEGALLKPDRGMNTLVVENSFAKLKIGLKDASLRVCCILYNNILLDNIIAKQTIKCLCRI